MTSLAVPARLTQTSVLGPRQAGNLASAPPAGAGVTGGSEGQWKLPGQRGLVPGPHLPTPGLLPGLPRSQLRPRSGHSRFHPSLEPVECALCLWTSPGEFQGMGQRGRGGRGEGGGTVSVLFTVEVLVPNLCLACGRDLEEIC